jgi:pimeloyl-ACP methyl ester carboxylesterase
MTGAPANMNGLTPEFQAWARDLTLDQLPPSVTDGYRTFSPDGPAHLPAVFDKIVELWRTESDLELGELEAVSRPTLVLIADDDIVTVEHAASMTRAIPNAELAVVPGTDHALMFEKPDLVNRLILDFLDDARPPRFMSADHAAS